MSGREALSVGRQGSTGRVGWLGRVVRPSWRIGSSHEALLVGGKALRGYPRGPGGVNVPSQMVGRGLKVLPEGQGVQRPCWRAGVYSGGLRVVGRCSQWAGSGPKFCAGWPGWVGRPWRACRGWEALPEGREGCEALLVGREGLGGLGGVERPSQSAGSGIQALTAGWEVLGGFTEGQEWSGGPP